MNSGVANMKCVLAIVCAVCCSAHAAFAGGSISWDEVSGRLAKSCPELLDAMTKSFEVNTVGGALRLGPRSLDVVEGRAEVGARVPPYQFECKVKGTMGPHNLQIEISDWDGGWKFIVRAKKGSPPK